MRVRLSLYVVLCGTSLLASQAVAQQPAPSLLPLPSVTLPAAYAQGPSSPSPAPMASDPAYAVPSDAVGQDYFSAAGWDGYAYGEEVPADESSPSDLPPPGEEGLASGACEDALSCEAYDGCDSCGLSACTCDRLWYASLAGLVMSRDRGNKLWLTYETNNNPNQLMHTQDAAVDWRGGFEARVGRYFCCGQSAVEVTYWTLQRLEGFSSLRDVNNNLSTPLDLQYTYIGSDLASSFFDNSREHRIYRTNEFHNVEINFLHFPLFGGGCSRLNVGLLGGFRYFRFDEGLLFAAASGNTEFGQSGGQNEGYLDVDVLNQLWGAQVGARANYLLFGGVSAYAAPSVGLYGNHITARSQLYSGSGAVGFDIPASKDDLAILSQLDLGLNWQITQRWSTFAGYRVVAISGVALSDNQVPFYTIAADEWADIDSNGHLLLHGAYAGGMFRF